MNRIFASLAAALALAGCYPATPPALSPATRPAGPATGAIAAAMSVAGSPPLTILISIDAFRPDYLGHGDTPNLDSLAAAGVSAALRPSFPTLTFPNHTTLVTGLRPDHHGVVANKFFDPARSEGFDSKALAASDPFWWTAAEPLWITAERAGVRTGTMFWPGEEVAHGNLRPSDWARFDPNVTSAQRVRTVLDWLARPAAIRPRFVVLYFDDVDKAGHKFGPRAPETIAAVRAMDTLIGRLRTTATGLPVNLVVVSDHGMREVLPDRTTRIDQLLPPDSIRLISYGPFATIDPLPGHETQVAAVLLAKHPHMTCWRPGTYPTRFGYGHNSRVASFGCLADAGGVIVPGEATNRGEHGYDPDDPDMSALFVAAGPLIRAGARVPRRFDNVDVYPFVARLIGVAPNANDGDPATLSEAIR